MSANPAIPDTGFVEQFNLQSEIGALESRRPWPQGMTSKMLFKSSDLRIVLIAMEAGAKMKEHHSDGRISIHAIRGAVTVRVNGEAKKMAAPQLLVMDKSIKHDVEALEPAVFLLTIAWPTEQELIGIKHRGYGS